MTDWFENWFDSEFYHILYSKRNEKEAKFFIDNILNILSPKKKSFFLDLACGKGRHSIYLNTKGFYVDGFDLSQNSLNTAIPYQNEKLHFFLRDMRFIKENNKYNYILNLFTSFGYFEHKKDNRLVVNGISKALKTDGVFIIDFLNINNCLNNLIEKETKIIQKREFNIKRWYDKKYLFKKIEFQHKKETKSYTERIQLLKKEEIISLCEKEKLKLIKSFGDYQLNKFDEKSERLILFFKKTIN